MPKAVRQGDTGKGHDRCPPTSATGGSSDVLINGKPAMRVGDAYAPHGCKDHAVHPRSQAAGSGTVFINGKALARVGDAIDCGGEATSGSDDVFVDEG